MLWWAAAVQVGCACTGTSAIREHVVMWQWGIIEVMVRRSLLCLSLRGTQQAPCILEGGMLHAERQESGLGWLVMMGKVCRVAYVINRR